MRTTLSLLFIACLALTVSAQSDSIKFSVGTPERLVANDIRWTGHFGGIKEEPQNVYTLMTQGGILAPRSVNLEDLVKEWLEKHPKAESILVYTLEGMSTNVPDSKMKAVWVVDGKENLNLYLVQNGACPAGTMVLNPGDETPLTKTEYESFEKEVWEAQRLLS